MTRTRRNASAAGEPTEPDRFGATRRRLPIASGRPGANRTQTFKLDRWMASPQQYAVIDPAVGRNEAGASFAPPGTGVAANPVGLGYWVYLPQDTTLTLAADPNRTRFLTRS